jgi:hypothetical protein
LIVQPQPNTLGTNSGSSGFHMRERSAHESVVASRRGCRGSCRVSVSAVPSPLDSTLRRTSADAAQQGGRVWSCNLQWSCPQQARPAKVRAREKHGVAFWRNRDMLRPGCRRVSASTAALGGTRRQACVAGYAPACFSAWAGTPQTIVSGRVVRSLCLRASSDFARRRGWSPPPARATH